MKKAVVILMLLVFSFNLVGYYFAFMAIRHSARKEIKRQIELNLPSDELTIIEANERSSSELIWIRPGKEFRYQGKMYDIVRSGSQNGIMTYECISDSQEDELFANLNEHIKKHISSGKPVKNKAANEISNHIPKLFFEQTYSVAYYPAVIKMDYPIVGDSYKLILSGSLILPPEAC